ncbi:hypothetical protein RJ639_027228 [Escallonia herrerae]|uniref:Reverse transcriptase RNase H-like domain-containing protein n=1 Tax=Escallonia herrerae TaxID=1293975 RepID=A0AA88X4P3_9ASTE|nr:hypothetical protein RJ639_027228 [Escallonia herrerae]
MEWEGRFQELQDRVEHHARHAEGGMEHSLRPRLREPKSYGGACDAKELENFLFDMEQYFRAIRVDSEAMKVSIAAMYLVGDAKLWWRKKYTEIEDGSCVINTWEMLKSELKMQFFSGNTAFSARKTLLKCKHSGSVRDYCQTFSTLMLDISDMSAVDRLFFFMEGLKPWAHTKLNRRQRQMMNAFFDNIGHVQRGEQSGSQSGQPPTEEQPDMQEYEEEDAVSAFPHWCNAVTTQVGNVNGEKPKDTHHGKGRRTRKRLDVCGHQGGVLMQECHPVAYESRKLNEAERRYTTHEKELLAVVHYLRVWRHYLLGSSFVVRTNNTAVSHFLSQSKLTSKQVRWQELLAEFNFMLKYRAGSTNSVADALSRRAELDQVALMAMNAIVRTDSRVAINIGKKIRNALTMDPVAQQLLKLVKSGKSAFEIVNGQQPLLPHTVNVPNTGKSPRAISFSEEWRQNIDLAHSYLDKAA